MVSLELLESVSYFISTARYLNVKQLITELLEIGQVSMLIEAS